MKHELTIFIVGGYGTFGRRIVELLEGEPRLTLIVAGRSLSSATAYCKERARAKARLVPVAFDRTGDLRAQLAFQRPDMLVDASGPFQAYGAGRYHLVRWCLTNGVNYLDLADGSEFVAGIHAFDDAARKAGLFVLSGVSSFPVLTAAVVRHLSRDMARVDAMRGGIAPSPYARVGENVIRAIAGYAGQRVELRRDGEATTGRPFADQQRYTIAPPGRLPLRSRLFSLVDVPDLRALPALWPDARTIWMGAAPVPELLHRALIGLVWLVRLRLLPSLSPFAGLMHFASNRLTWGEHRGGMFVAVEGSGASGGPLKRSWHMLAEGDDGPFIPSMAVAALVRRALDGRVPAPGARAAVSELDLADYEPLFAGRAIHAATRDDTASESASLYRNLLGSAWDQLPVEIRAMHEGTTLARGHASVKRGPGRLARLIGRMMGFPDAAEDVPVQVRFDCADGEETWTRTFGDQSFSSRQFAGCGRSERLLCESFGPLTFAMALLSDGGRLRLVLRRWTVYGLPLPMWLCPRSSAYETNDGGRFNFHVEISHPVAGVIVHYAGWLVPEHEAVGETAAASEAAAAAEIAAVSASLPDSSSRAEPSPPSGADDRTKFDLRSVFQRPKNSQSA